MKVVVELKRGACACELVWAGGSGAGQSPRRASWRSKLARHTAPQFARRSLRMIVDYFTLSSCFDAMGTFSVGLNVLVSCVAGCAVPACCF